MVSAVAVEAAAANTGVTTADRDSERVGKRAVATRYTQITEMSSQLPVPVLSGSLSRATRALAVTPQRNSRLTDPNPPVVSRGGRR